MYSVNQRDGLFWYADSSLVLYSQGVRLFPESSEYDKVFLTVSLFAVRRGTVVGHECGGVRDDVVFFSEPPTVCGV